MARSMNDLPPKQQWLVAGLLCVVLVVVYYMQFWRSYQETIGRTEAQIAQTRGEVQRMEAIARRLPDIEAEKQLLERRLDILANILPEEYETADLLRGVGQLAAQSNLDLTDLEFEDPVPFEFYAESPITLELTGTYHDLGRFFDRVSKLARIINVDEVLIEAVNDEQDPLSTVRAQITAKTFIFIEQPEPAAEQEEGA